MSACTSPEPTSRSTPWRISCPATRTRSPSIFRVLMLMRLRPPALDRPCDGAPSCGPPDLRLARQNDLHVVAVDHDVVHPYRAGGRQGLRLAGQQRERRAVLRALDLALVGPHIALGERVIGVR